MPKKPPCLYVYLDKKVGLQRPKYKPNGLCIFLVENSNLPITLNNRPYKRKALPQSSNKQGRVTNKLKVIATRHQFVYAYTLFIVLKIPRYIYIVVLGF